MVQLLMGLLVGLQIIGGIIGGTLKLLVGQIPPISDIGGTESRCPTQDYALEVKFFLGYLVH